MDLVDPQGQGPSPEDEALLEERLAAWLQRKVTVALRVNNAAEVMSVLQTAARRSAEMQKRGTIVGMQLTAGGNTEFEPNRPGVLGSGMLQFLFSTEAAYECPFPCQVDCTALHASFADTADKASFLMQYLMRYSEIQITGLLPDFAEGIIIACYTVMQEVAAVGSPREKSYLMAVEQDGGLQLRLYYSGGAKARA
eukprot:TRINITY_DN18152_c0_g1_i2.p1 TRINITY_DN18152_c0_g1~~TRINITY_DN18152_c0_g1_i2.p1  ORF type:complete len:215 (+),score=46.78 TRINITY_DN18152_c0_g1_i2:58-645(+)